MFLGENFLSGTIKNSQPYDASLQSDIFEVKEEKTFNLKFYDLFA
jgi:hypothetical protein